MPGLIRGVARTAVIAGTASAVSGRVQRRQQGRWAEQDAQAAARQAQPYAAPQASPAAAPGAPSTGTSDTIAQLRELAALRDQGILTDDEFGAQKARILDT